MRLRETLDREAVGLHDTLDREAVCLHESLDRERQWVYMIHWIERDIGFT